MLDTSLLLLAILLCYWSPPTINHVCKPKWLLIITRRPPWSLLCLSFLSLLFLLGIDNLWPPLKTHNWPLSNSQSLLPIIKNQEPPSTTRSEPTISQPCCQTVIQNHHRHHHHETLSALIYNLNHHHKQSFNLITMKRRFCILGCKPFLTTINSPSSALSHHRLVYCTAMLLLGDTIKNQHITHHHPPWTPTVNSLTFLTTNHYQSFLGSAMNHHLASSWNTCR